MDSKTHPASGPRRRNLTRRRFLSTVTRTAAAATVGPAAFSRAARADDQKKAGPVVDTHMHVWTNDTKKYPFDNPNNPDFTPPEPAGTQEMLLEEMDAFGIDYAVLVQVIYYGWDNRYVVDCVKAHPKRFRGHGLIDPTDPKVADKLDYWVREQGLSGMRFSPIYYKNRDQWLDGDASVALWKKAAELGAIFNFFIETTQLPRLENMIRRFPDVRVVIDHFARVDLKLADPDHEFKKLLRLARYPHVYCKVSELSVISPSGAYPYEDTFPYVRQLYDAFGPARLMWGTGFPGATRTANGRPTLEQELALVRREVPVFTAEDRAKILGENAAKLWGFV